MRKIAKELEICSAIAIVFVVLKHSNAYYLTQILNFQTYGDAGLFLTVIDQIIHVAVPLFIFVAGFKYQINNKKELNITFFMKRLSKVLVPFLLISIFFILANNFDVLLNENVNMISLINNMILDFVGVFFGFNFAYQLWYIPMYLFVVLLYPLLSMYIKDLRIRFILFSMLSISYVLISSFSDILGLLSTPLSFFYYFLFFEIGCYVAKSSVSRCIHYLLFICYFIILLLSIFTVGSKYESVVTDLILAPISVLTFYYFSLYLKDNLFLAKLGSYSFYIYLFHEPIFVSYLSGLLNERHIYNSYYVTLLIVVISIILSIFWYKFLVKIGLAKFIFFNIKKSNIQRI